MNCVRCHRERKLEARGLCSACYSSCQRTETLTSYPRKPPAANDPVYCTCSEPDYDKLDVCRHCGRNDLRAPRQAATFRRVKRRYTSTTR